MAYTNVSLFPVPHANSVGSTQMGNAITEISFPGKRISFDRHFRNAVENMDVSEVFLPLVSKDVIGIGQPTRPALSAQAVERSTVVIWKTRIFRKKGRCRSMTMLCRKT